MRTATSLDRKSLEQEVLTDKYVSAIFERLSNDLNISFNAINNKNGILPITFNRAAPQENPFIKALTASYIVVPDMPSLDEGWITGNKDFQTYQKKLMEEGYKAKIIDTTPTSDVDSLNSQRVIATSVILTSIPVSVYSPIIGVGSLIGGVGILGLASTTEGLIWKTTNAKATLQIEKLEPEEPA